jgi:hypothetical protein
MKKNLLLFFLTCTISLNAQVTSSCSVPPALWTHYELDIKNLTLGRMYQLQTPDTAFIHIPQAWTDTVAQGLAAILNASSIPEVDSVFNLYCVHDVNDWYVAGNSIMVRVDLNYPWTQAWQNLSSMTGNPFIDTMMVHYDLQVTYFYNWAIGDYAILETDSIWNIYALMDSLETEPGVISSELNSMIGGAGHIAYSKIGVDRYYEFYFEFNDCFDGCDNYHNWRFRVGPDCSVEYLGFVDWGFFSIQPLPPPLNCNAFVSVKENSSEGSFTVYPNPASATATVIMKNKAGNRVLITLFNAEGKEVKTISEITRDEIKIDMSDLSQGLYIFRIYQDGQPIGSGKISKE